MPSGRKTIREEFAIKQRYADLTEPAFKFIKECFEIGEVADKKWAVEQLNKGFVKMIPQAIEGSEDGVPIIIKIAKEIADKHDDTDSSPVNSSV